MEIGVKNADNRKMRNYKRILYGILCCACIALACVQYSFLYEKLPNTIKIKAGQEQNIDFGLPASATLYKEVVPASGAPKSNIPQNAIYLELDQPVTFKANQEDHYSMEIKKTP